MEKPRPLLEKPTLDKDLDKLTLTEEASHFVMKPWAGYGMALLFLIFSMMFAVASVSSQPTALIVIAASAVAAYMAINIGANDVTNNVGAAVGSKAISLSTALCIAAVFEIAGAVMGSGRTVATIQGGIFDASDLQTGMTVVFVMLAALMSSAVWINISTWLSAPISTTHATVGGILGAGIAAAGVSAVHWTSLVGIALSWTVSPFLGGGIAALLLAFLKTFIVYRDNRVEQARFWTPILLAVTTGCFTSYLALIALDNRIHLAWSTGMQAGLLAGLVAYLVTRPIVARQAAGLDNRNQSLRKLFRLPLILSAAILSFAHGANDVSNAVGPLSAIVANVNGLATVGTTYAPLWTILIGGFGIACGLLLFGPKLIRVVGQEITKLNPLRAFCVALSTAATVLLAASQGLPVSTTHTAVGAVFGIGFFREWYTRNSKRRLDYVRQKTGRDDFEQRAQHSPDELKRRQLVRRSHLMTIIGAWMITVPVSACFSALIYIVLVAIFS